MLALQTQTFDLRSAENRQGINVLETTSHGRPQTNRGQANVGLVELRLSNTNGLPC